MKDFLQWQNEIENTLGRCLQEDEVSFLHTIFERYIEEQQKILTQRQEEKSTISF